jgi:DNA-binding SARP family transcriptional activator
MSAPPPLALTCFGPPDVRVAGQRPPADVLWHKHLALVVYLALSPDHCRSREHLLGLLWPEKDESAARHSLSEALRRLRTGLGAGRVVADADRVALAPESLDADVLSFETLAPREPERAAALYRGDFLEGFALGGGAAFDDWADGERARLRTRASSVLVAAGERALARGRGGAAADLALRAAAIEPLAEPPVRLLMRARALAGDAAGALVAFRGFTERLKAELQELPGRDLAALAERVRTGRWRRAGESGAEPESLPLVGRERLHAEAFGQVAAAMSGDARVLLITGAAGLGKSRLIAECLARAALEGAVVAAARPLAADQDVPWSTLRQLLHGPLATAPGHKAAEPAALGVVAAFAPALAERVPPRERADAASVADALAAFLAAVTEEQPVALAVDDAHLGDGASLAALRQALAAVPGAALCVICAATDQADAWPPELTALAREAGSGLAGAAVTLGPVGEPEVLALARALDPHRDPVDTARLARRVALEAGGSPLLALTVLRAVTRDRALADDLAAWPPRGHTMDASLPSGSSRALRLAVLIQVAGLDAAARAALAVATLGQVPVDAILIAAITGHAPAPLAAGLAELERRHLLVYESGRYRLAAPVLARVVAAELLTGGERDALRQRIIAAMEVRPEPEWRLAAAGLLAEPGPSARAFAVAAQVAQEAVSTGATHLARRSLSTVRAALDPVDPDQQATLAELSRDLDDKARGAG